MDTDINSPNREELSPGLETAVGAIRETERQCPGIWYVSTRGDGRYPGTEFYVVDRDASGIPTDAGKFGLSVPECPGLLLYPMDQEPQIRKIIEYEIHAFHTHSRSRAAERSILRETALYGMDECPAYFGTHPVPVETPYGYTVRHKTLMNGAFWLETDQRTRMIAVSFPVWPDVFSCYVKRLADDTDVYADRDGYGCLYFLGKAMCLAVFELRRVYREARTCPLIDPDALMNAIWTDFPDYAVSFNTLEQSGGDDMLGRALSDSAGNLSGGEWYGNVSGDEPPEHTSVARMIRITPDAGTVYLKF